MNRDELRRLEKAAREKDKKYLAEWAKQFEDQIHAVYRREYERAYQQEIQSSIDNFIVALAYTLVYSEETLIKKENIAGFMEDLFVTVDMFRTGEYTPDEYREDLAKYGIIPDTYDYTKVYNDRITQLNKLLDEYIEKLDNLNSNKNDV